MHELSEPLRNVMRQWVSGVAVATSRVGKTIHGMTVNSFNSISLDPPIVTVTLASRTRTFDLVSQSGLFGITILHFDQEEISLRFAGKIPEEDGRFLGLNTFTLNTGVPLIEGGIGFLDCRVVHQYAMKKSTLFVGEVLAAKFLKNQNPLIYFNREYRRLEI